MDGPDVPDLGETFADFNDPRYPNFSPWTIIKAAIGLQIGGYAALTGLSNPNYMDSLSTRLGKHPRIEDQDSIVPSIPRPSQGPSKKAKFKPTGVSVGSQTRKHIPQRYYILDRGFGRYSRRSNFRRRRFRSRFRSRRFKRRKPFRRFRSYRRRR